MRAVETTRDRSRTPPHAQGFCSKVTRALRAYGLGPALKGGLARICNKVFRTKFESRPSSISARRRGAVKDSSLVAASSKDTAEWLKLRHGSERHLLKFADTAHRRQQQGPRPAGDELRVIYIVPDLKLFGGVISVLQIVNNLVQQGVNANVATYVTYDEDFVRGFPLSFTPHRFPDRRTMLENFPECDVVVATWWETVFDALAIQQQRPQVRLAYFVQDYEADFYSPESENARRAELTYSLIHPKIVKTKWLADKLADFPGHIQQIPLGLNLDIFSAKKDPARQEKTRVVSMARPASPRRNFEGTLAILGEVKRRRLDTTIALYGSDLEAVSIPFEHESYGRLYRMEEVAELLNKSTVLLDCSLFQGFGRPGLEAMACGTATVLTCHGGITEYAKDLHNCLLADPLDVEDNVQKVIRLLEEKELRSKLVEEGLKTARAYDCRIEAGKTLEFLREIMRP